MHIVIQTWSEETASEAIRIWNEVVESGIAFPQTELLTEESGRVFFAEQAFTGVAIDADSGTVVGMYILHPNNVGRCGHICNASYAVKSSMRGKKVGETLVRHSIQQGEEMGFRILQFNAVVRSNHAALHLYKKLGFVPLGVIPGGFRKTDGTYEDIIPYYRSLVYANSNQSMLEGF